MERLKLAIVLFSFTMLGTAAKAQNVTTSKLEEPIEDGFSIVEWNGVKALKLSGSIDFGTTKKFNELADFAEPVISPT
ncbi:MAG: hypothetical protein ABJZ69_15950 [Hyphomicrobiales bacterium]